MFLKKRKYDVLVLGCDGMLGREAYDRLYLLSMSDSSNIGKVIGIDVKDGIDLTRRHALGDFMDNCIHFDYCVNCVAYTDTKSAETTKAGREADYRLNALAPRYIAESCRKHRTRLVHISTDYVFSENSRNSLNIYPTKFMPYDEPFPCSVYGYDKLLGEMAIKEEFAGKDKDFCILRTSWIYGMHNSKSFVHKFVRNLVKTAKEGKTECEMTENEFSIPTSCCYVTDCIVSTITDRRYGTHHAVPCCEKTGVSRLQFAEHIQKWFPDIEINGIKLSEIKLVGVKRDSYWPKYSAMATTCSPCEWTGLLDCFMKENSCRILEWAKTENNV